MRQSYAPLREFDVASALGRTEQSHWNEAAAMERGKVDEVTVSREGSGSQLQANAQPTPSMDAPVLSRD